MSGSEKLDRARRLILEATLPHVPFDGWTDAALDAGKRDAALEDAETRLAFPGGVEELAEFYASFADQRMVAALAADDLGAMGVRRKIAHAITLRLEQAAPEREALQGLMTWLSLPQNHVLGAKCLYATVDAMWRSIGDRSTDFNFYTKRATLAAVLAAVVMYWLGDETENFADTRKFIDRRMEDVMAIEKAKGRVRAALKDLPDPFEILGRLRKD